MLDSKPEPPEPPEPPERLDQPVASAAQVVVAAVAVAPLAAPVVDASVDVAPAVAAPEVVAPPAAPVVDAPVVVAPPAAPVVDAPVDVAPAVAAPIIATPEAAGEGPPMRQPDPAAPFVAVLLGPGAEALDLADLPAPVLDMRPKVLGVLCRNDHFNDPSLRYCSVCGISMAQQTLVQHEGPRPPLGVLLLDDGSTFRLDLDYIVGREPQADPEVISGTVRPLRITDPDGVVSRRHLRVALVGWNVEVVDLGSANGTFVALPGDQERHQLAPNQPFVVRPGTQVTMGRRWFRYESYRNP
jgi:hypothetical protein